MVSHDSLMEVEVLTGCLEFLSECMELGYKVLLFRLGRSTKDSNLEVSR
jgi:hypothetical protein